MQKETQTQVGTKRLLLTPMTEAETEALIAATQDEELRGAYEEMLDGCRRNPANSVWYAPWKMLLRENGVMIGDLCFKGPARDGAVEIGYGIQPAYEGRGYTTEAVQAMVQWAFCQSKVLYVEAETEPQNKASQRILEKCGFVPHGTGKEGPRFRLKKPEQA